MTRRALRRNPGIAALPSPPEEYDRRDQAEFRRQVERIADTIVVTHEAIDDVNDAAEAAGKDYVREEVEETDTLATLTLIPIDGAPDFGAILVSTKEGNLPWSAYAPIAADGSGNYVDTVAMVEKHPSKIAYQVWVDGDGDGTVDTIVQQNVVTFDLGTIANTLSLAVAYDGRGTASVTVNVDTDTDLGTGGVRYRLDSGAWVDAVVGAGRTAVFDVTQITTPQDLEVEAGRDVGTVDEAYGPTRSIEIESFTVPVSPAAVTSAEVSTPTGSGFNVTITWYNVNVEDKTGTWTIDIDEFKGGVLYRQVLTGRAAVDGTDTFSVDQNDGTGSTTSDYYYVVRLRKDSQDYATAKSNTVTGY